MQFIPSTPTTVIGVTCDVYDDVLTETTQLNGCHQIRTRRKPFRTEFLNPWPQLEAEPRPKASPGTYWVRCVSVSWL